MKKTAILLILALLLLPIFLSVAVYADTPQDVVYNFDSTTYDGLICKNNDANLPACSDYRYLKIETDFVISNLYNQSLTISPNGYSKNVIPVNQTLDLSQMTNLTQFYVGFSLLSGTNYTATITLTNNNGCPDPEPCPECPLDCDDNFIVSWFKIIFINLVTGIIPVCAIIFVVWFFIDMITSFVFGRGR